MSEKSNNVENKAVKEEGPEASEGASKEIDLDSLEEAAQEPSAAEKMAQMEKDYLYLRAELDNIKRQNIKERSQLLKYGGERLARDLLDTLDVFKSALESEVTDANFKDFVKGVEMTAQSLRTTLEKHGVKEVDAVGLPFDPNTQEALSSEPSKEHPEGHVTQVFKAPFNYHDKLLRPGQVIVSRGKPEVS